MANTLLSYIGTSVVTLLLQLWIVQVGSELSSKLLCPLLPEADHSGLQVIVSK